MEYGEGDRTGDLGRGPGEVGGATRPSGFRYWDVTPMGSTGIRRGGLAIGVGSPAGMGVRTKVNASLIGDGTRYVSWATGEGTRKLPEGEGG